MYKKNAIVTGGTSGIGLSLVKELAKASYKITFVGTNREKGTAIERELQVKYPNSELIFEQLDLSEFSNIQEFVKRFISNNGKLDLLANIAGVLLPNYEETSKGIEKSFQVSYLSSFQLTRGLVPLLEKGKSPRIVNVSASPSVILKAEIDFDNLNCSNSYNGFKASTLAVHAKTVFTQSLAHRLQGRGISVNSFHPGNIKSSLFREMPLLQRILMKSVSTFFKRTSRSASYVCFDPSIQNVSGKLFVGEKATDLAFTDSYAEKLWSISESLLEKVS